MFVSFEMFHYLIRTRELVLDHSEMSQRCVKAPSVLIVYVSPYSNSLIGYNLISVRRVRVRSPAIPNLWTRGCPNIGKAPSDAKPFDSPRPLVLTHLDLTPYNLILDDDNRLWMVDWGLSGVYPEWFEYVCMLPSWKHLCGWYDKLLCQFVAGRFEDQYRFMVHIGSVLTFGVLM